MKTVETVWDRGMVYKAVAQTVLIYGINSRLVTGLMMKVLKGFHHWAARRITGMTDRRAEEG